MMIWSSLLHEIDVVGEAALISVVRAFGSTPREAGARMIATEKGTIGTIGGGALEWQSVEASRRYLCAKGPSPRQPVIRSQALGPDLGQCCGGRVEIITEIFDRQDRRLLQSLADREHIGRFSLTGRIVADDFVEYFGERRRKLYIFGAGHVGNAIVTALRPLVETSLTVAALPLEIVWVDSRAECLDLVAARHVALRHTEDPAALVPQIEAGSLVLILTHSHALDYDIAAACLRRTDLSYVGLIGSATKRARFLHRFRDDGVSSDQLQKLTCPIGIGAIHSKHPAAIAAGVVAQLLVCVQEVQSVGAVPAALAGTQPVVAATCVENGEAGETLACRSCQSDRSLSRESVIKFQSIKDRAG